MKTLKYIARIRSIILGLALAIPVVAQTVIFKDTFDAADDLAQLNESDGLYYVWTLDNGFPARQAMGLYTSTFTELSGAQIAFLQDGAKVLERSSEKMTVNTNFAGPLGTYPFSLRFDLKMIGTQSQRWTNISMVDANTNEFNTGLSLFVWGVPDGNTLLGLRSGTGSHRLIAKSTLDQLFGGNFNVNEWHHYTINVLPEDGITGTMELLINDIVVVKDVRYVFTEVTTRRLNFATNNIVAHFDNLTLIRNPDLPPEPLSFWTASSLHESSNWRFSGDGYPFETGIGWINDEHWPFVYSLREDLSASEAGSWLYFDEESSHRGKFWAYDYANESWISGFGHIGWYYSYESESEGWQPFKGAIATSKPPVELLEHLTSASELEDVRDIAATFDDSGARRVLELNVSNPVSTQRGAWVAVPPPAGGWDLDHVHNVQATIKNTGAAAVETILWVVGSNGWSAVGDQINLQPGTTAVLKCNLRQTYPDGTPKLDPGQIKHIRIMTQGAATASLEVTGLTASASGSVEDWVRPAGRLDVPDMVEDTPAAGRRVRYQLAADVGSDIYSVLYLPKDWQPGETYPVIAETPGNYFYSATACWSTGRPEQCVMGYGISEGNNAIWVSLPFVDRTTGTIAENGFGSNAGADTVTYMQAVMDDICQNWGGDSDNLFLTGFSRGAIACGYIGLANDEIAKLWKGFVACQHYDGSAWNQSNMTGAITRAPRFQGEAIFQVDNSRWAANFEQLMDYTDPAVEWTWVSSGLGYHSTAMFLDDRPMMIQLRQWFHDLTAEYEHITVE